MINSGRLSAGDTDVIPPTEDKRRGRWADIERCMARLECAGWHVAGYGGNGGEGYQELHIRLVRGPRWSTRTERR